MAEPLWTWRDLIAATRGRAEGTAAGGVTGISIDTRTLVPGDLFVALRGDNQDGHVYVSKAFEMGAAAALVSEDFVTPTGAGPLIRVGDPDRDPALVALERLGAAARARLAPDARVIAVTGSVGKTSTKEMLRLCLTSVDPRTHASEKSYNNHWGVPLTLARMPAGTKYGVFEIGMNHGGEIRPLSKMVRPHLAIITTVGPVHLEFFPNEEAIADAKAEIFEGLEPSGTAVLPADNRHFERLKAAANAAHAIVVTFGTVPGPNGPFLDFAASASETSRNFGTSVGPIVRGVPSNWELAVGALGDHQVFNALATIAAVEAVGLDPRICKSAMAGFSAAEGRGAVLRYPYRAGQVTLLDESYNANPISVEAALRLLSLTKSLEGGKRSIAVLGDMRELGDSSRQLHAALLQPVTDAHIDLVFACGPHMRALFDALPDHLRGGYAERSDGLIAPLLATVRSGDVIMIKGSLGTRMAPIVEALKAHLTALSAKQKD